MPLLECRNIVRLFGPDVVLDGVDLVVERGERIGLVGANGSGKTTLCRLLLGWDEPDEGRIIFAGGTQVGYLAQDPELDLSATIRTEALRVFDDLRDLETDLHAASEALGEPAEPDELERRLAHHSQLLSELDARGGFNYEQRMLAALGALGFAPDDLDRPVGSLSGGEKSRLALAKLLFGGCDLLLLDEPTNHLDIAMCEWLEGFLCDYPGAVIVVSHDRWFLDHVCQKIAELESGRIEVYYFGDGEAKLPPPEEPGAEDGADPGHYGAYTHFLRVKNQRREAAWKAYLNQQKTLKKQEDWIRWKLSLRRGRHVAEAESRQKMLDKIDRVDRPADDLPVVLLNFDPKHRGPNDIVDIKHCAFGYGRRRLFEGLDLFVRRLQRVGIVGPNGCGKSSLLKLLLGEMQPLEGSARLAPTCDLGYYHQEHRDLDLELSPLEALREVAPDLSVPQIRGFLARFLFFGDDVFRPAHTFSGGERSRLVLARLIVRRPNVLLLDEPTNHLDIASREVLEEALSDFQGTVVVVSHDRWFLNRICRRLLYFGEAGPQVFEGTWSQWEARELAQREAAEAAEAQAKKARQKAHQVWEKEARAGRVAKRQDRASMRDLEQSIERTEAAIAALHDRFADPALYEDGAQVRAAQQDEARLQDELAELYERWEALVEAGV